MNLNSARFFRLELTVIGCVWLVYLQCRSRYVAWPRVRTLIHFLFLLIFAEIGACGIRTAIGVVSATSVFLETFRQPNILHLPGNLMCWVAGAYALAGTVFFITVMYVGEMNAKAHRIFYILVGPCTLLYPAVMGSHMRAWDWLSRSSSAVWVIFVAFAVIALVGAGVVRSNEQGGANGRQPFSSDTNRTSAAAASRRSP